MRLLAAWTAGLGLPRPGRATPVDRGIGGTGSAPDEPSDRGIGGTGVVGTIRGFGSIVVNDRHIAYDTGVRVTVDGLPAGLDDLRLGHLVRVLASPTHTGLTTDRIDVIHEVIGAVEHVSGHALTVLGQSVVSPHDLSWRRGDRVAVSGLRRPNGVIVASLIEADHTHVDRVTGLLRRARGGTLSIGGLRVRFREAALAGQRVVLTGRSRWGRFVALSGSNEVDALARLGATHYSLEAFVARDRDGLATGNGYALAASAAAQPVPATGVVRAVLSASLGSTGQVVVDAVRVTGPGHAPGAEGQPRGQSPHGVPNRSLSQPGGPGAPDGAQRGGPHSPDGLGPGRGGGPAGPGTRGGLGGRR